VGEQTLTFRVSGKLWMRSLVMSDLETNTEWSHLLGRAMAGKLKGKELEPLVTDMMTWGGWQAEFPQTTVLNMPRTSQAFSKEFYRDPSKFVFGFQAGGSAWSLGMHQLLNHPVHPFAIGGEALLATFDKASTSTRLFAAQVDGRPLEFQQIDDQQMQDTQTGSRWKITNGEAISGALKGKRLRQRVGIMSFRKAWHNFHPDSQDVKF
jgi:hypothetical protein